MIRIPMLTTEKLLTEEHNDGDMPFRIFNDRIEVKEDAKLKPEEYQLMESQQKKIRLPPCFAPDGLGYGDIDGDGYVTDDDAQLVSDYTVGNVTLTDAQLIRADVNNDGDVTITDAMMIARYAAGLEDSFTVCSINELDWNIIFLIAGAALGTILLVKRI